MADFINQMRAEQWLLSFVYAERRNERMAYYVVDDYGFGGAIYKCSECGEYRCDLFEDIDLERCEACGADINGDDNVYFYHT